MLRPSIFGESLFDDWMDDFPFGKEFEKTMFPAKDPLYGKHAKNMMKTVMVRQWLLHRLIR